PSAGIKKTWGVPDRSLTKAICFPSGENFGLRSRAGWRVSGFAGPPAIGTLQISPPQAKASVAPSGETAMSVARRMGSGWGPCAEAVAAAPRARSGASDRVQRAFTARTPRRRIWGSLSGWGEPADRPRFRTILSGGHALDKSPPKRPTPAEVAS